MRATRWYSSSNVFLWTEAVRAHMLRVSFLPSQQAQLHEISAKLPLADVDQER